MKEQDCTTGRWSMIGFGGEIIKLTVKLIPHHIIPEKVRDAMVEAMHEKHTVWHNRPNMGCFFQHEVGGNMRESMIEVDKIYEDWLESIGVEKGETILQEWDW